MADLAWCFLARPIVGDDFHEELQYALAPARYCLPGRPERKGTNGEMAWEDRGPGDRGYS